MDKPKVSVVMPVWNTPEEYLREAVESILTQTFSDFEFIIVDDGSTKHNVTAILESYRDERIILIKNKVNAGVSRARNLGMKKSRGDYVALMDADDVSYPERLQKEVDFLDRHPEIAMVSTGKRFIPAGRAEVPEFANDKLRDYLLFRGCFIQTGAVMMRRTVFEDYGLYFNPELDVAEDYDMWLRMLAYFNPANIYEPLYGYRRHGWRRQFDADADERRATLRLCRPRAAGVHGLHWQTCWLFHHILHLLGCLSGGVDGDEGTGAEIPIN